MGVSGRSFDPKMPPSPSGRVVDYALARRSLILQVRRGLIGSTDVCDAHPELLRAARNIGEDSDKQCPICSHETLRLVRYVYGAALGRDNGRVVYPAEWLNELIKKHEEFTCYIVEVCIDCAWNHLIRSYTAGKGSRRAGHPRSSGTVQA
ncbi:MAG: DUF5318 family protein [Actinomycetota bacterium]